MSFARSSSPKCIFAMIALLCASCSRIDHFAIKQSQTAIFDSTSESSLVGWTTYGHDYGNLRFSELSQINTGNIARLVPVYIFQTNIIGAFETSPIVSSGVMYISTPNDGVFAIDAVNGTMIWKRPPLAGVFRQCCGPVNRGVAISKSLVIIGQLDGQVVALERKTGTIKWSTRLANNADGYSITMAPLVFRDSVIVGTGGGDLGIRGTLACLSLRDGKLKWRWYATDAKHWFGESLRLRTDDGLLSSGASMRARTRFAKSWMRGGGGVWTTPAIDKQRDTIYIATGNPWPDLDGTRRPGDNLFTDCIVALDASTGHMRWYFQEVSHDTMDLDAASPPVLLDTVDGNGKRVAALAEVGKTGFLYLLNRDTGKLIRRSQQLAAVDRDRKGAWAGGASWSPMSFDPTLRYVIVSASQYLKPQSGTRADSDEMVRAWERVYSSVTAVDVTTGIVAWQDEFNGGLVGGTTSTAGRLTFVGEGDGNFDAIDTNTGARLWQFQTGAGVNAPPIVFEVRDAEYVAVASGGNQQLRTPLGDALFVFRLQN